MRFQELMISGVALALGPLLSFAQPATLSDPADTTVSVPAMHYDSALTGYIAYQEQQAGSWRAQNEEMGRVGGHAGHIKGSVEGIQPHSEQKTPAESDMPHGTTDHGSHGKK